MIRAARLRELHAEVKTMHHECDSALVLARPDSPYADSLRRRAVALLDISMVLTLFELSEWERDTHHEEGA